MSETWYVVPAAFALRNVSRDEREDTQSTWRLPEAWRKSATTAIATQKENQTAKARHGR